MSSAITGWEGSPSVKRGIKVPLAAALLAASGACYPFDRARAEFLRVP